MPPSSSAGRGGAALGGCGLRPSGCRVGRTGGLRGSWGAGQVSRDHPPGLRGEPYSGRLMPLGSTEGGVWQRGSKNAAKNV